MLYKIKIVNRSDGSVVDRVIINAMDGAEACQDVVEHYHRTGVNPGRFKYYVKKLRGLTYPMI